MTDIPQRSGKKLGLVIDLDTCVGCHACAVACKEWNDGGQFGPLPDSDLLGAEPDGVWFNRVHTFEVEPGNGNGDSGIGASDSRFEGPDSQNVQDPATADRIPSPESQIPASMTIHFPRSCLHCEEPDCVSVCPTGASYKRAEDGIVLVDEDKCIGCQLCAWACPYGAREFNHDHGVMQKCTLCVDRIYNDSLDEADRQPACVSACPTRARHFGDLGDPASDVSQLVAERGGYGLLPEMGYRPVNRYLPPRPRRVSESVSAKSSGPTQETLDTEQLSTSLRWLNQLLSR